MCINALEYAVQKVTAIL